MKKLTIIFLTILVCFTPRIALSNAVSADALVERNGIMYIKASNKPFTGSMITMDDSRFTHVGTFVDGKKDGPYKVYHANGRIMQKGIFRDGIFFPK